LLDNNFIDKYLPVDIKCGNENIVD